MVLSRILKILVLKRCLIHVSTGHSRILLMTETGGTGVARFEIMR